MKNYSVEQLSTILTNHKKWLDGKKSGERANLIGANLSGANLIGANLIGANLIGANLSDANLRRADLRRADLSGANLRRADLSGANLRRADLSGANLSGANLSDADLSYADLYRTYGDMDVIFSMQIDTYPISFTKDVLQISCKIFQIKKWWELKDDQIKNMDGEKGYNWWVKWNSVIKQVIETKLDIKIDNEVKDA